MVAAHVCFAHSGSEHVASRQKTVNGPVHHQHTKLRFDSLFSRKFVYQFFLGEKINWIDAPNSNGRDVCLLAMKFCCSVWARMVGGRGHAAKIRRCSCGVDRMRILQVLELAAHVRGLREISWP